MLLSSKVIVFFFGFLIGFYLYVVLFVKTNTVREQILEPEVKGIYEKEYNEWLERQGLRAERLVTPLDPGHSALESDVLRDKVDVACAVFFESRKNAYMVHNTWGSKCNSLHFFGREKDNFVPVEVVRSKTKWGEVCEAIRRLWEQRPILQWVVFSPDDVFLIPENLRYFLAAKNPQEPHYFGHRVVFWKSLYNSGKTAFVLSREALQRLVTKFNSSQLCASTKQVINDPFFALGRELSTVGVKAGETRDDMGRERFHIFTMDQLMSTDNPEVIAKNSRTSLYPVLQGKECCSKSSVSFRSSQSDRTYFISYLLYKAVVAQGAGLSLPSPPPVTNETQVWMEFVIGALGKDADPSRLGPDEYYRLWVEKTWEPEESNRLIAAFHAIL